MKKVYKVTSSVYRKIAIDLAKNITEGKYAEGQKLYGRSVLASYYGVSPETVRKAVYLLKDVGILETEKGSGIEVKSAERAREFVKLQSEIENVTDAKNEVLSWAKNQAKEIERIIGKVQLMAETAERLKNVGPFAPYDIKITAQSSVIGKTAAELGFWHNTGATITAIRRGESLIVSPGPYATFNEDDVFYIIGDSSAYAAALRLIFGANGERADNC